MDKNLKNLWPAVDWRLEAFKSLEKERCTTFFSLEHIDAADYDFLANLDQLSILDVLASKNDDVGSLLSSQLLKAFDGMNFQNFLNLWNFVRNFAIGSDKVSQVVHLDLIIFYWLSHLVFNLL